MLPSKQCMKDILKYVSQNINVEVDNMDFHNITVNSFNLSTLLEQMPKEGKYTMEEIAYNFLQCYNNKLIDAQISYQSPKSIQSSTSFIYGVSLSGVDFIQE